jgi:hypothetical protein
MSRLWLRRILFTFGFLAFPGAVVPWLLGVLMILAAGSGESSSVRNNGTVTCPELLEWTPWTDGEGVLRRGDFTFGIAENTTIIAHRVGTHAKLFARLTMYQAKYQYPDGHIEVWAANGPTPIVSVDDFAAATWAASILVAGVVSLVIASRLKR